MQSKYPMIRIGDLVDSVKKWSPVESQENKLFTYIDISSVNRDTKQVDQASDIFTHEAPSRARQIVKAGDVLVSTVRPNLNAVAQLGNNLDDATASTGFCVLRPNTEKVNARYLYYWVRAPYFIDEMTRKSTGATYPAVSDSIIKNSTLPLPPIEEQQRIAAILDQADGLRRKRQEAIRLTEELLRATFLDMFGDPVTNPKGWECHQLQNISEKIIDCPHSTPKWADRGIICLRTSNLTEGGWNWDDTRYVNRQDYEGRTSRSKICSGDIILSREGTVGVAAIVLENMKVCMGQRLVQVRPEQKKIRSHYLLQLLLWQLAPERINRLMRGSTSQHFNVKDLRVMLMPIPPLEIQKQFSEFAIQLSNFQSNSKISLNEKNNLFNSLLQRAFRGEL